MPLSFRYIFLSFLCFFTSQVALGENYLTDNIPRFVIIVAFAPELSKLLTEIKKDPTHKDIHLIGKTFYTGRLGGKDVVLVQSGEGMVNAAMTAQAATDHFKVKGIIVSGIAGGVDPNIRIGDVVIPTQWSEYQYQLFAKKIGTHWDTKPFSTDVAFKNFDMIFPRKITLPRMDGKPGEEDRRWLPVSTQLIAVAKQTANKQAITAFHIMVGGNGISGDTIVNNAEYREFLWKNFKADALDTESAAVAHVAYLNQIPFISFRSISDLAGGEAGENKLRTFFKVAADNAALFVLSFLNNLPN